MNRVALFTLITLLACLGCSKPQKPALPPPPAPPPKEEPAVVENAAPKRDIIGLLEKTARDLAEKCDQRLTQVRLATWQPPKDEYAQVLGRCVGHDFDLLELAADFERKGVIPPEYMPQLEKLRTKINGRILYRLALMRCLHKVQHDKGLMKCMAAEGKKIRKELSTVPKKNLSANARNTPELNPGLLIIQKPRMDGAFN